jgi:hypothetical protein
MTFRACFAAAAAVTVLTFSAAASAQSEGARTHDGFFLRLSAGVGPGWFTEEQEVFGESREVEASGPTAMFELLIGGTPAPGLVVGGGLMGHSVINPTLEANGREFETEDTSVGVSQAALFVNYHIDPHAGFCLLGSVGYGVGVVTVEDESRDTDTDGLVLGFGLGYDFWVGSQWSIGPSFRLTYAALSNEEDGLEVSDTFVSPTLGFTATYH